MSQAEYEFKAKKKFPWGWTITGLIAFALFGSCTYAFVGMFGNIEEVKPINRAFLEDALNNEMPEASDPRFSELDVFPQEGLDQIDEMLSIVGKPESIGEAACNAHSNASTNEVSGQFVMCTTPVTFEISPANVEMTWRLEDGAWKVMRFFLNVDDAEAYYARKSELANQAEAADPKQKNADLGDSKTSVSE